MTDHAPSASGPVSAPNPDALLLVAAETGGAYSDLARRLSAVAPTRLCSLGAGARAGLAATMDGGPVRVVAVPLSTRGSDPLLAGLSGLLRWASVRWPGATFLQSAPFGTPRHVVGWASCRAQAALAASPDPTPPAETALLVVGADGAVPEANAEVCATARLLWEGRDYGLVEAAFARGTRPDAAGGIERCLRLGARHVVVLPLALLDGPVCEALRAQVAIARERGVRVTCADPLLTPTTAASVARQRRKAALARWLQHGDNGLAPAHEHDHGHDHAHGHDRGDGLGQHHDHGHGHDHGHDHGHEMPSPRRPGAWTDDAAPGLRP